MVAGAGQVRTLHDGDIQAGTDEKSTERTAYLKLRGQCGKAAVTVHGQLRRKPAHYPGLRAAKEAGSLGDGGIHLPVRMFIQGYRRRTVPAWYP